MANSKRKCKYHGCSIREYIVVNNSAFCTFDAAVQYANENKAKGAAVVRKSQKKKDTVRKKELMSRVKWYAKLQILVNQCVVHVWCKGEPCYTCGTNNPSIKYDAGHRYHAGRGGGDRRRFLKQNIKKQCSVNCNQYGGGMPKEFDIALDKEYGQGFSDVLNCVSNYPTLKQQFPIWQDIEAEILRYRKLLRDNSITPNA